MKVSEYIERVKEHYGWDDEAEKEWRELQEDAKQLKKLTKGTSLQKVLDNTIIVEELKKRIEELTRLWNGKIDRQTEWGRELSEPNIDPLRRAINELQKILEGKDGTN